MKIVILWAAFLICGVTLVEGTYIHRAMFTAPQFLPNNQIPSVAYSM